MRAVPKVLSCVVLGVAALAGGTSAAEAAVSPFGKLTCTVDAAHGNVRVCVGTTPKPPSQELPTGSTGPDTRVLSFDNLPMDVNVVLPATGDTGLPLVTMIHGFGGDKYAPAADAGESGQLGSMVGYAQRGYAVLSYAARGFKESCGTASSRAAAFAISPAAGAACQRGWIHLDDMRYEARDAQWLMGLLVDQGIADPQRLGVTGVSYGGIITTQLAALKDRMWTFSGTDPGTAKLVPFTSPAGAPMRIAGAAPSIPGSDLAYSLIPNGRTTDYLLADRKDDIAPAGIPKLSFITGLFATGVRGFGYYAPPGADSHADIQTWYARILAGDPFDEPVAQGILEEISRWHSAYALLSADAPPKQAPAPILFGSGFTDDLFPVDEALRFANKAWSLFPSTPISFFFADYGHARGQNKGADLAKLRAAYAAWMDHYVKGDGADPFHGVTTLTQTCPKDAPSGGPFTAGTWAAIHPGEVRQRYNTTVTVSSAGGDPSLGTTVDPVASTTPSGPGACATTPAGDQDAPAAATFRLGRVATAYTLLGAPTVTARITASAGGFPQLAARLWDVGTDGRQTLAARALYRPEGKGDPEVFQLHANGYRFAAGHQVKLELLGADAPYGRPSTGGAFTLTIAGLEVRLPVHEDPDCTEVLPHAPPFTGGRVLAPGVSATGTTGCGGAVPASQSSVGASAATVNGQPTSPTGTVTPGAGGGAAAARQRVGLQLRCGRARPVVRLVGADRGRARRVVFSAGGKRLGTDAKAPFTARVPLKATRQRARLRAVVRFKDGRSRTVSLRAHRCRAAR